MLVYEISMSLVIFFIVIVFRTMFLNQVYEISMSTVIKMECDDCSPGNLVEEETISHIREKVTIGKYSKPSTNIGIYWETFKTIGKYSKVWANIQNHWHIFETNCQLIRIICKSFS